MAVVVVEERADADADGGADDVDDTDDVEDAEDAGWPPLEQAVRAAAVITHTVTTTLHRGELTPASVAWRSLTATAGTNRPRRHAHGQGLLVVGPPLL